MTLTEILTAAATQHQVTVSDFTINGQNLGLVALNNARRAAEMQHDFEFTRNLLTVTVNGVTGGDLSTAVLYGTATTVEVGTVVECGLFDEDGNLWPVEWTTVAEGLERARENNSYITPRYPTDAWFSSAIRGQMRFQFSGDNVFVFPKDDAHNYTLGIEAFVISDEWEAGDLSTTPTNWGTKGAEYLLWAVISELNPHFQTFVYRQEGNVSDRNIEKKRDTAFARFQEWDIMRFEQLRRHD